MIAGRASSVRRGVSLIELLVSLASSSILLAGLGMCVLTVARSNDVVIDPESQSEQTLQQWLRRDLAMATFVDTPGSNQLSIQTVDFAGAPETILYQVNSSGLLRRVNSNAPVEIAPAITSLSYSAQPFNAFAESNWCSQFLPAGSDGVQANEVPSIRGYRSVEDDKSADEIALEIPPQTRPGDVMILAASCSGNNTLDTSDPGWSVVADQSINFTLRMMVWSKVYDPTVTSPITVTSDRSGAFNGVLICVANGDPVAPIAQAIGSTGGVGFGSTQPAPLMASLTQTDELDVEIFAATLRSSSELSMGMPGFCDIASCYSDMNLFVKQSLYVSVRQGPSNELDIMPRANFVFNSFAQVGIRVQP